MTRTPRMALAALALGLSMLPVFAAEPEEDDPDKIFTCTASDGSVAFQQEPCEEAKPAPKKSAAVEPKASAKKTTAAGLPKAKAVTYVLRESKTTSPTVAPPLKNVPWEPTWRAFVDAMNQGDRPGAVRCLTARALTELGPKIHASAPEALREMVGAYDRVVVEGDVGPYWSIRVLRAGARPKWVFFERTARGEWKIAAI